MTDVISMVAVEVQEKGMHDVSETISLVRRISVDLEILPPCQMMTQQCDGPTVTKGALPAASPPDTYPLATVSYRKSEESDPSMRVQFVTPGVEPSVYSDCSDSSHSLPHLDALWSSSPEKAVKMPPPPKRMARFKRKIKLAFLKRSRSEFSHSEFSHSAEDLDSLKSSSLSLPRTSSGHYEVGALVRSDRLWSRSKSSRCKPERSELKSKRASIFGRKETFIVNH